MAKTIVTKTLILLTIVLAPEIGWAAPPVHAVTGGGTVEYAGALNVHAFTAQIDGEGDVKGHAEFQLRAIGVSLQVEITCLAVIDNIAWMGGIIRDASDATLVGQTVLFRVQDNGNEGEGNTGEEEQEVDMTSPLVIGVTVPECGSTRSLGLISWANGSVSVR